MTKKPGELRNAIRLSIIEGAFAQIYGSLSFIGTVFIIKFVILLKASFSIGKYFVKESLPYAFVIIFGTAAVAGLYGLFILNKQPEMPKKVETESSGTLLLSPFKDRNYRKLIIFRC